MRHPGARSPFRADRLVEDVEDEERIRNRRAELRRLQDSKGLRRRPPATTPDKLLSHRPRSLTKVKPFLLSSSNYRSKSPGQPRTPHMIPSSAPSPRFPISALEIDTDAVPPSPLVVPPDDNEEQQQQEEEEDRDLQRLTPRSPHRIPSTYVPRFEVHNTTTNNEPPTTDIEFVDDVPSAQLPPSILRQREPQQQPHGDAIQALFPEDTSDVADLRPPLPTNNVHSTNNRDSSLDVVGTPSRTQLDNKTTPAKSLATTPSPSSLNRTRIKLLKEFAWQIQEHGWEVAQAWAQDHMVVGSTMAAATTTTTTSSNVPLAWPLPCRVSITGEASNWLNASGNSEWLGKQEFASPLGKFVVSNETSNRRGEVTAWRVTATLMGAGGKNSSVVVYGKDSVLYRLAGQATWSEMESVSTNLPQLQSLRIKYFDTQQGRKAKCSLDLVVEQAMFVREQYVWALQYAALAVHRVHLETAAKGKGAAGKTTLRFVVDNPRASQSTISWMIGSLLQGLVSGVYWILVGMPILVLKTCLTWMVTLSALGMIYLYALEGCRTSGIQSPHLAVASFFDNSVPGVV